jgi:hypothetical protein
MGRWLITQEKTPKIKRARMKFRQWQHLLARQGVERSLDALFGKQDYRADGRKPKTYNAAHRRKNVATSV